MRAVLEHISTQRGRLSEHPFFHEIQQCPRVEQALAFAPRLSFWVMCTQDVLRLNAQRSQELRCTHLLHRHQAEGRNHEFWFFLEDVALLTDQTLTLTELWSDAHESIRDASHMLMAEVFRPLDDRLRIALVLALESTHCGFFTRIAPLARSWSRGRQLKYLADQDTQAQQRLESLEKQVEARLTTPELTAELREEAIAMADRVFAVFTTLLDALRADVQAAVAAAPAPKPRRHLTLVPSSDS